MVLCEKNFCEKFHNCVTYDATIHSTIEFVYTNDTSEGCYNCQFRQVTLLDSFHCMHTLCTYCLLAGYHINTSQNMR